MFRFSHLMGALSVLALATPVAAAAQDGSRVVMRRPLGPVADQQNQEVPPTKEPISCGTAGNPCPDKCEFWDPRWVIDEGDDTVCVGQSVSGTAVCKAFTSSRRDTDPVVVPDSVCLEDTASYRARCG